MPEPNEDFADRLLSWYDKLGRHDLPWRQQITAYRVWVSEIMLQQTQVRTVVPYFHRFMATLPQVEALATAPDDQVMHLWAGLGYYSRARNLQRAGQQICSDYGGQIPIDVKTLVTLPGIGRSTAGAIASIAGGQRAAILDGNVKRVLARHAGIQGWPGETRVSKQLWTVAEARTPELRAGDYAQGIMDLGATLCRRSQPDCLHCPVREDCIAHQLQTPEQFPGRKPARKQPVRSVIMPLLCRADGAVLLEKRPASGIWSNLWSLPELGSVAEVEQLALDYCGQPPLQLTELAPLRHSFSHFHLDIQPVLVTVREAGPGVAERETRWYTPGAGATIGLPAPIQRLLEGLDSQKEFTQP
jgi:A/G-specific adenine glycosylase